MWKMAQLLNITFEGRTTRWWVDMVKRNQEQGRSHFRLFTYESKKFISVRSKLCQDDSKIKG